MGSFSSKFYITLVVSNSTICDYFMLFSSMYCSLNYNAKMIEKHPYRIIKELCYPYKFKKELIKKYELIQKIYKRRYPNDQITIIFGKDIKIKVEIIERYWKKYRWNYLRNLAAWKYHPSKIDFTI